MLATCAEQAVLLTWVLAIVPSATFSGVVLPVELAKGCLGRAAGIALPRVLL